MAENEQKQYVAIDIGSGYTNVVAGENDKEILFASRVCRAPHGWQDDFNAAVHRWVRFGEKAERTEWLLGDAVRAVRATPENSLLDRWAMSQGWLVLLYSALADLKGVVNFKEPILLATGLPQAFFKTQWKEVKHSLTGEHRFEVNGIEHSVEIENVVVVPQATAALLYQRSRDESLRGDVGCIDVGTYTTGLAVIDMDELKVIERRSTGCQLGVSNLLRSLETYLKQHHNLHLDGQRLLLALQERMVRVRGETVDLGVVINQITARESAPILDFIQSAWTGGADLDVYLAGGGADLFADTIRTVVPHAEVMVDPQWAVARGLSSYLKSTVSAARDGHAERT